MRQTLLVGGLLSVSASVVAAIVAQGCAAGSVGEAQSFLEDGGGGGVEGGGPPVVVDGSGLNTIDSATGPTQDANGLQTCVHNTDCTSPNLCVGDNGVECAGGFCVPTGQPMNCDDGIACTTDSCDANTNACVHTPNDSACPNGEYCDPTQNCVQELPCTPGDSVCDRLNVSPCAGLWSCDSTKMYCVEGIAPCPSIPNAVTACNGSLADGGVPPVIDGGPVTLDSGTEAIDAGPIACSWTCLPGFDHRVWTGSTWEEVFAIASPPDTAGCECQFTETADGGIAYDPPDMGFVDSNCDGIDGTMAGAIFVDTAKGNDATGTGAMNAPFKTINAGITAASSASPKKTDVYVSMGIYSEAVSLVNGISLYGGYNAASGWQRSAGNTTSIIGPATVGLVASNLTVATQVQLFTIESSENATGVDANGDGNSGVGVLVLNSTGQVTIEGCTIHAVGGAPRSNGGPGGIGGSGTPGNSANGTNYGTGGAGCVAGNGGGNGGVSVSGTITGNNGSSGFAVGGGGQAGAFGVGGGEGSCPTIGSAHSGYPGNQPTSTGGTGGPGANGSAAVTQFGGFDSSGNYIPPASSSMGATGNPGGGGGGGGAGGGTAGGTNFFCTDCSGFASGGGGGGGGGGCGGTGGNGGHGGGGSFGVLSVSSNLVVDSTTIVTGIGGVGGTGGNGGPGGPGGGYGTGGSGNQDGSCSGVSGGPGGPGNSGGPGGNGGGGAGGAGGPSICVASQGGSTSVTNNFGSSSCTTPPSGALGGTGGSNGSANAPSGPTGLSAAQN